MCPGSGAGWSRVCQKNPNFKNFEYFRSYWIQRYISSIWAFQCTPFLKTVEGSSRNRKPWFSNFFCRNVCYCFCDIYEITTPICIKFCTEVTSHVPNPTPQVSLEWVSPIGIYDPFPKVTCYNTVQNSEVVQPTTCHCFIFWFWNSDHKN